MAHRTDLHARATAAMGGEAKRSTATAALLVLVACNLALGLSKLSPPPSAHDDPARVEPMGYVASVASTVLAAYVASAACRVLGGFSLEIESLLAEVRRTWTRPAMTALYIELLTTAMASLLLTLRAFLGAVSGAAAGLMAVSGSVALVGWLGPVLFAHSDIACRMSLVVAAVEEGCEGRAAVERAEALVTGRRARGIAIAVAASVIEQAPTWCCGDHAPAFVVGPAVLAAKLVACYAISAFYYECRNRHDKNSSSSRSKLEGMVKCCDTGSDRELPMVDHETEAEESDSAFDRFRLA